MESGEAYNNKKIGNMASIPDLEFKDSFDRIRIYTEHHSAQDPDTHPACSLLLSVKNICFILDLRPPE